MRKLLCRAAVLCICCWSLTIYANNNEKNSDNYSYFQQSKPSKVQVGRASEFEEVTEFTQTITTFDELMVYLEQRQYASDTEAIDMVQRFVFSRSTSQQPLNKEQLQNIDLALAELLINVGQLQQSQSVLNKYQQTDMKPLNWLVSRQLQSRIYQLRQDWFAAVTGFTEVFELAEELLKQSSINEQTLARKKQLDSALSLARIYWQILDNNQAKQWLNTALSLTDAKQDLASYFEVTTLVASQQQHMKAYDSAARTLIPAIESANTNRLVSVELSLSRQLGEVYLAANKLDDAQEVLEKSYLLARGLRNISQQYGLLINLIELQLAKNNSTEAQKILTETDKLTKYITDRNLTMAFLNAKAQVFAAKRQFVDALNVLERISEISHSNGSSLEEQGRQDIVSSNLKQKATWQALLGQSRSAISNFEKHHKDAQQTLTQKAQQRIQFIQQSYAADRQNKQQQIAESQQVIQQLQAETAQLRFESTRNFIVYVLMFLAALGYWLFHNKQQIAERQRMMNLDLITGAKNHNYLARRFRQYLHHKAKFSVLMFDIDKFSEVNISIGHDKADILCREIVTRLSIRLSAEKELISIGSGKFMVIVKNFDQKQAFLLAEVLRKELNSQSFVIDGSRFNITASFAAIEYNASETLESLKQALTLGVQIAKQAGGDRTAQLKDN